MKKFFALVLLLVCPILSYAEAVVGTAAPAFSAKTATGKTINLSDYKGKYVVLEWFNHGCPYVRKHYGTNNMQRLQEKYTSKGVIWLSVLSSAEGKEGYTDAAGALADAATHGTKSTEIVLDASGSLGKTYGAKSTPHMFIINPEGKLIYQGAIDDNDSTRQTSVEGAHNYVAAALDESMSGKPVTISSTESYGCSVKYAE